MLSHPLRHLLLTAAITIAGLLLVGGPAAADNHPFDDIVGNGYQDAVEALAWEGLVNGCDERKFCADRILTRAQAASLIARATGLLDDDVEESGADPTDGDTVLLPDDDTATITTLADLLADEMSDDAEATESDDVDAVDADENRFGDVDDDGTHSEGIFAIAEAGITLGCDADNFCPDDLLTREQLTTLLYRAFDVESSEVRAFDDVDGSHRAAVDAFAAAGFTAGCSDRLQNFCPGDEVPRWQAALMLARVVGLAPMVEIAPLDERRAQQDEIDAEAERQRLAEEEAARKAAEAAKLEQYQTSRLATWEALAQCESNGNWSINTGNGYYGGLQFALATWRSVGGSGYPHQNSKAEQIRRGEILQQRSGWGQWPACSRKLGLRS